MVDIRKQYEDGLQGASFNAADYEALMASVERDRAEDVACDQGFADDFAGKLVAPWVHVEKVYPGCWPGAAQQRGDCFPPGTMVRMADGSERPIESIEVGEYVQSHTGESRKVIDKIDKPYAGHLVELSAKGTVRSISATPDHRFYNPRPDLIAGEWSAIGEMMAGDTVLLPRHGQRNSEVQFDLGECPAAITEDHNGRCELPAPGKVRGKFGNREVNRYIALDERLAWLVGLYLAEGSCDVSKYGPKRITFNLCSKERIIAEQAAQYVEDIFGVEATISGIPSKPNVLYVRVGNAPVAWLFASLANGNTYSKSVPAQVFSCSRSIRLAMLRGWMDGDGHFASGRRKGTDWYRCKLSGVSASCELARGMFDLANSCGLKATTTRRKARGASQPATDVHMYGSNAAAVYPEVDIKCSLTRKSAAAAISEHGIAATVKSVSRKYYSGRVYCLGVDVDHSFVANGYGVHNCVSHSAKNAILGSLIADVVSGTPDPVSGKVEEAPTVSAIGIKQGVLSTEAPYWFRGYNDDGWYSSAAMRTARTKAGAVPRGPLANTGIDLTKYSGSLAGKYGRNEPTGDVADALDNNLFREVTEAQTFEEVRDMLGRGFFASTDGGESWSNKRDANGVSERTRAGWAHAMAFIGADDRDEVKRAYGEPLVLIINSWGKWNTGPRKVLGTDLQIPEGAFWSRWSDAKRRRIYHVSGCNGWERQALPDYDPGAV